MMLKSVGTRRKLIFNKSFVANEDCSKIDAMSADGKTKTNERRLALLGLLITIVVLLGKFYTTYEPLIKERLYLRELIKTQWKDIATGVDYISYHWESSLRTFKMDWLYSLCLALAFTVFSWMMIYYDSDVPGVNPSMPFSPRKTRSQSKQRIDFSYVFVIASGIVMFILLV